MIDELRGMGVTVAQLGKEYGPGQYEMSVRHGDPIRGGRRLLVAERGGARRGEAVRLRRRPSCRNRMRICGQQSPRAPELLGCGRPVDLTPADDQTSLVRRWRLVHGRILKHAEALTGLGSPTVNSYKRLLPGSWAPANTYWGYGNRSGVARVPGVGKRRHIEFRSGDNSCQPLSTMTGLLAAGFDGIRNRIDPARPFQGDIGHLTPRRSSGTRSGSCRVRCRRRWPRWRADPFHRGGGGSGDLSISSS